MNESIIFSRIAENLTTSGLGLWVLDLYHTWRTVFEYKTKPFYHSSFDPRGLWTMKKIMYYKIIWSKISEFMWFLKLKTVISIHNNEFSLIVSKTHGNNRIQKLCLRCSETVCNYPQIEWFYKKIKFRFKN